MADGLCALLLLLLLLLCAPARSDRTSLSVRFVNSDAARPVLLHWKRPTGELKRWSELQPRTDSSVKSFSGDTWVVTDAADTGVVVREILLDVANGNPQAVDLATGEQLPAPPGAPAQGGAAAAGKAVGVDDKNYDAWSVEVGGLQDDYGFEFSPAHLASERRVTLWAAAGSEPDGSLAPFGVQANADGFVTGLTPPSRLPRSEARMVIGAEIVAVEGMPVDRRLPYWGAQADKDWAGAVQAVLLQREVAEEVTLTIACVSDDGGGPTPCPGDEARARLPLKDCPYLPPRSRPAAKATVRKLFEYQAWATKLGRAFDFPGGGAGAQQGKDVQIWSLDPLVLTIDNFFDAKELHYIRTHAEGSLHRATVSSTKGGLASQGRTNDVTWINHDADKQAWAIVSKLAEVVGLPTDHAEPLQVIRYQVGQQYRKHWDAYDIHTERGQRILSTSGNRLVTALGYINTVEQGGGTELPNLGLTVPAVAGRLLIFHDCYPGTASKHANTLHAGLPVTAGDKWAFNLWFHEKPQGQGARAAAKMRGSHAPEDGGLFGHDI